MTSPSSHDAFSNRKRGRASQERFFRLLSPPSAIPDWIILVAPVGDSSFDDQKRGIDFYVLTEDSKSVPVDVKSSFTRRAKGKRKRSSTSVCTVVIEDRLDDDQMRKVIIQVLEKWKKSRLP